MYRKWYLNILSFSSKKHIAESMYFWPCLINWFIFLISFSSLTSAAYFLWCIYKLFLCYIVCKNAQPFLNEATICYRLIKDDTSVHEIAWKSKNNRNAVTTKSLVTWFPLLMEFLFLQLNRKLSFSNSRWLSFINVLVKLVV